MHFSNKNNSREGIAFAGFISGCHIKRIHIHKTTKGWAAKGKCTMGWFYGFKLHLIINEMGEIIQWQLTPGNVDDRAPLKDSEFTEKLFGKLFADRGHISQNLLEKLFVDDIHLVTKIKKNMKNSLTDLHDKILLRKRSIIETMNDELKNVCNIEHTRHKSVDNVATIIWLDLLHTISCLRNHRRISKSRTKAKLLHKDYAKLMLRII